MCAVEVQLEVFHEGAAASSIATCSVRESRGTGDAQAVLAKRVDCVPCHPGPHW